MSKNLEKYDKLVVFLLVIIASVFAVGWWFAEEKSAPQYSTKIDKLNRSQIQKHMSIIKKGLNMRPEDKLIPFSGVSKSGVKELWDELERLIGYEKEVTE